MFSESKKRFLCILILCSGLAVVTSSRSTSFMHFFHINFQILMFSNQVQLNLSHKLREDLREWCAKMVDQFENC